MQELASSSSTATASLPTSYTPTLIGNFPGTIYRGENPFRSSSDLKNLEAIKKRNITHIVTLLEEKKSVEIYTQNGFKVIHFPIRDFSTPNNPVQFNRFIRKLVELAQDPACSTLVHCQAGVGRTGLVLACFLKAISGVDGKQAIEEIRKKIPGAVETKQQRIFVENYKFTPIKVQQVRTRTRSSAQKKAVHLAKLELQFKSAPVGKRGRVRRNAIRLQIKAYSS